MSRTRTSVDETAASDTASPGQALPDARRAKVGGTALVALWVLGGVVVVALPWLGMNAVWTQRLVDIALLALVVSGLNLSFGYAGELALGQPAMYAGGAYLAGYASIHWVNDALVALLLGAAAALVFGVVSGIPGLRLGGWMLAIASVFLVFLIPDVLSLLREYVGGHTGLSGIPRMRVFGTELGHNGYFAVTMATTVLLFAGFRNLVQSQHGRAFLVLRESPVLAQSLGISVYGMKLKAYALGALPAGIAGALFAYSDGFIHPGYFGFDLLIMVVAASVIGGSESVWGPFLGSSVLVLADRQLQSLRDFSLVLFGVLLVASGVFLAGGLAELFGRLRRRPSSGGEALSTPATVSTDSEPVRTEVELGRLEGELLTVSGVSKSFGGVHALRDVSLAAEPGRITALIGPNGSGKTTLLNVICGYYSADAGSTALGGSDLTGAAPHRVAQRGTARTFQTPLVPSTLTVRQVVETGRYVGDYVSMGSTIARLPAWRRLRQRNSRSSIEILRSLRIEHLADEVAAVLPLGTRRLVELGRAIAAKPKLVLLDEIASGLDENELDEMATVVRGIRDAGATVVLVEHNFGLVRSIADHIVVLGEGRLIAEGDPDYVASHPDVLEHYLGESRPDAVGDEHPVEPGGLP